MEVVSASYRTDLTGAEHAGHIGRSQTVHEMARIVAGGAEQVSSPTVAGEDQGALGPVGAKSCGKVPGRRSGIPDLELEGGSDLNPLADGHRP